MNKGGVMFVRCDPKAKPIVNVLQNIEIKSANQVGADVVPESVSEVPMDMMEESVGTHLESLLDQYETGEIDLPNLDLTMLDGIEEEIRNGSPCPSTLEVEPSTSLSNNEVPVANKAITKSPTPGPSKMSSAAPPKKGKRLPCLSLKRPKKIDVDSDDDFATPPPPKSPKVPPMKIKMTSGGKNITSMMVADIKALDEKNDDEDEETEGYRGIVLKMFRDLKKSCSKYTARREVLQSEHRVINEEKVRLERELERFRLREEQIGTELKQLEVDIKNNKIWLQKFFK